MVVIQYAQLEEGVSLAVSLSYGSALKPTENGLERIQGFTGPGLPSLQLGSGKLPKLKPRLETPFGG